MKIALRIRIIKYATLLGCILVLIVLGLSVHCNLYNAPNTALYPGLVGKTCVENNFK